MGASSIDPKLIEAREATRQAEAGLTRPRPTDATIDPKLIEEREATRAREAELAGRSFRQPPGR
jgi:hypothetical protein